jgi:hypothetical protein
MVAYEWLYVLTNTVFFKCKSNQWENSKETHLPWFLSIFYNYQFLYSHIKNDSGLKRTLVSAMGLKASLTCNATYISGVRHSKEYIMSISVK